MLLHYFPTLLLDVRVLVCGSTERKKSLFRKTHNIYISKLINANRYMLKLLESLKMNEMAQKNTVKFNNP